MSSQKDGAFQSQSVSDPDKRKIRSAKHNQAEVRERIAAIITTPNKSWAKRKKQEKYSIPRNYFGQYA
jgi:hypothetical protein